MCSPHRALLVLSKNQPAPENAMKTRLLIDQHESFADLVRHINRHNAFSRCQLAGLYAYQMAGADYPNDDEMIKDGFAQGGIDSMFNGHINLLAKRGCRINKHVSLQWARGYADLPCDLNN